MSSYPCPVCKTMADLESACPGCGRAPDPDAAEVIRLDGRLAVAHARLEQLRRDYATSSTEYQELQARRSKLAAKVWASVHAATPVVPGPAAVPTRSVGVPVGPGTAPPTVARPEASPRTVQNLLLILGGLLLGTAAIVFTAVAWATVGAGGRAVILAVITALTLAVPLVAKARGLRATAETFAALGLLLVVLDGVAAWLTDLAHVTELSPVTYTGVVAGVTAAVGLLYGLATGLTGPRIVAAVAVQPVAPLLLAEAIDDRMVGWSLLFSGIAAANLVLIALARRRPAAPEGDAPRMSPLAITLGVIGWLALVPSLLYAHAVAHVLLWFDRYASWEGPTALAASLLVAVAVGFAVGSRVLLGIACGWSVVVVTEVVWRVAWQDNPNHQLVRVALAIAGIGIALALVAKIGGPTAAAARTGARVGGLVVAGIAGVVAVFRALEVAVRSVVDATPWWHGAASADPGFDWALPTSLLLLTVAVVALVRPGFDGVNGLPGALDLGAGGVVMTILAAAPTHAAAPWGASAMDLAGAAALLAWAWWRARGLSPTLLLPLWIGAIALSVHGLLAGLGTPVLSAAVAGALMLMGVVLALSSRGPSGDEATAARRVPGAVGLASAIALTPLLVASLAEAADAPSRTVFHSAVAAIALLPAVLLLVRQNATLRLGALVGYGVIAAATVPMTLIQADVADGSPNPIYIAIGGLGAAVAAALAGSWRKAPSAIALLLVLPAITLMVSVETLVAVFIAPLSWLGEGWSGVVAGAGLTPDGLGARLPSARTVDAVAITIVAVTIGLIIFAATGRLRLALTTLARLASIPLLVWLAVAQAPWPIVPLVTLVGGLAVIVAALLRRFSAVGGPALLAVGVVTGAVQVVSGFAGLLPEKWSTITAFALVTFAFGVVAVAGRSVGVKATGALLAGPAWIGTAITSAVAADLSRRYVGLTILGAAAVLLFIATIGLPMVRAAATASGDPSTSDGPAAVSEVPIPDGEADAAVAVEPEPVSDAVPAAVAVGGGWRRAHWLLGLSALEPIAHLTALVVLAMALGSARRIAETCLLWGIVVGLTALWAPNRLARTIAAGAIETAAWWALLVARDVSVLEAYTVPVAVVGLVIGFFALRKRPELSSWAGYGPALMAAFGPSTIAMLPLDSPLWRRLALGAVALVVVVAGAVRHRQAPVVLGGIVLIVLAVHEIVVSWHRLSPWVWFAVGGAVLVGMGITYERRRRDISVLREKISTMR
ncbi:hypothetical protein F4553_005203 [Allocatelliglobosispora scoriae]|uniref:DUF2157 domain-containing protein n=1 Tax=Allocatelliglobosispora scoriae TaxID=643052 RepID=A0A841BUE6_9ACTN|nr:hypothetical protein [Allocatelliglobosispora scoriae]MBB5871824.1 hypothetical protein [Allocatelliglobosispora scoriae]